jgi:hypothetical protein
MTIIRIESKQYVKMHLLNHNKEIHLYQSVSHTYWGQYFFVMDDKAWSEDREGEETGIMS